MQAFLQLIAVLVTAVAADNFCSGQLRKIANLEFSAEVSGWNVAFTPCRNAYKCPNETVMLCQYLDAGDTVVLSSMSSVKASAWSNAGGGHGYEWIIQNGESCGEVYGDRLVDFNFTCGPTTDMTIQVSETSPCRYSVQATVECSAAAPVSGGGEGGTIFVIVFFVSAILYCGIGAALNHRKGLTGTEMIPQREFWMGLPGLVKDGIKFTMGGCKKGGTYESF